MKARRIVHRVVREAQAAAVEAVRPGIPAQEIDRIARRIITDAGYGGHFIHRTGHGIGLEPHEDPSLMEGNELVLEEGMVFSVEPGIYLRGCFGVRIEDIVAVTPGRREADERGRGEDDRSAPPSRPLPRWPALESTKTLPPAARSERRYEGRGGSTPS